nr:hypothetical protein GCM10020093_081840 [Planobispora longispora]
MSEMASAHEESRNGFHGGSHDAQVIPIDRGRSSRGAGGFADFDGALDPEDDRRLAELLAFVRRRIAGEYEVDEFGFDAELTDKVLLEIMRPLYRHWFRAETVDVENVPGESGALVVANHSGTIPLDALMLQVALHDDHPDRRALRLLGADLVYQLPLLGHLARKTGHTLACREDADRLLRKGELVGVFPEGFKGVGKPFSERYKLQRFGRGGSSPRPSGPGSRSSPARSWGRRRSTPRSVISVSSPGRWACRTCRSPRSSPGSASSGWSRSRRSG